MRILVTGAAGFIGSHLAQRLAQEGHEVVGIDNFSDYYDVSLKEANAKDIEGQGVRIFRLDLAQDDLQEAVAGAEAAYHFAAQPGIADHVPLEGFVRNNITATDRILEAVKGQDSFKFFVNVSTSSVYGRDVTGDEESVPAPTSYYGVTKLAGEQLALAEQRENGLPACSVRMFSVYGPRERPDKLLPRVMASLFRGEPMPLFEGSRDHLRSYTYVADIIDGFLLILNDPEKCNGEIFNFGLDGCITTGELLDVAERVSGKKLVIDPKPKRAGDQQKTQANIGKARRVLGYEPRITPEEGVSKMIDWYKEKFI